MIDWSKISLKELAGFVSEELRKRGIDTVKDRLGSFYHWNDKQGLQQAINICLEQQIDFTEVERWSVHEEHEEKFRFFIKCLKEANSDSP